MTKGIGTVAFVAGIGLAMALYLTGCAEGKVKDSLIYGTTDKVTDMDSASAYDFHTWEIFNNINESLLAYVPGGTDIVPGLAESYVVSPAGDEFTFKLRKGLRFTDGSDFNAEAVKWTIDRVARLGGDPSWLVTQFVKEVAVVDPLTVRITLKGPTPFFPQILAGNPPYYPLSPSVYPTDHIVKDPSELKGGQLVGMGPYKVTTFKRDEEIVLEANPNYYGPKPRIGKIVIRYFADATTMRLALQNGDVDMVFKSLNPSDIADLAKNPKITTYRLPGPFIRYLSFETSQGQFKDGRLRRALAALVNRTEINKKVYLGQNEPLYTMVPKGLQSHEEAFKTVYGADGDPTLATKLIKEAGYSEQRPLIFDLWYTMTHYGDVEVNLAEVLKAQFEKSPLVKVTLKSAEWATFKEQYDKKVMAVWLDGWYPDYVDADDYLAPFGGTQGSKGNGQNWSNKDWDAALAKEETSLDPKLRGEVFSSLQTAWATEVPTLPLLQGNLYVLSQKNVTGVKINPSLIFRYDSITFGR